jgi:hypothetical protein
MIQIIGWQEKYSTGVSETKFIISDGIMVVTLLELPTKQFYPKCQSARVLPSSQSAWSIAALSCIGSRPASRQTIIDGHSERKAVSDSAATNK